MGWSAETLNSTQLGQGQVGLSAETACAHFASSGKLARATRALSPRSKKASFASVDPAHYSGRHPAHRLAAALEEHLHRHPAQPVILCQVRIVRAVRRVPRLPHTPPAPRPPPPPPGPPPLLP